MAVVCSSCGASAPSGSRYCAACGAVLTRPSNRDYVGATIAGKYRVEAQLGEGGMGRVFRATQLALDKPVVLKVLRHNLLSDERTVARFHREAKAASRLNHPNSISVLDFGQAEDGALFIAMEYVGGQDLHQVLAKEWPLPESRIIRIVSQVLSALADAHAAGVIHRDLKPENIMVEPRRGGETDFIKVLDFGIAKIQDPSSEDGKTITRAGYVCGTPEYMSPEQARGVGVDHRSDLYAVGVILYQLTTGSLPFDADNAMGFATKHLTETPVPPSRKRTGVRISAAMEKLILKALSKNPNERPQSAEAFKAELQWVERESRAEQAKKMGTSSPVLNPLSPKLAAALARHSSEETEGAGAGEPIDDRTPQDGGLMMDRRPPTNDRTPRDGSARVRLGSARDTEEGTDRDEVDAAGHPPDASDATSPARRVAPSSPSAVYRQRMRLWKWVTAVLLVGTAGFAGYLALYWWSPRSAPRSSVAVQQLINVSADPDVQRPLYEEEIPPERWRPDEARSLAASADLLRKQGNLSLARTKYQDAFAAKPDPAYSLALGWLFYADKTLPAVQRGSLARGWWRRHLQDDPDSKARGTIVGIFPELGKDDTIAPTDLEGTP